MSDNIKQKAKKNETKRGNLISRKPGKRLSQTKNKNSPVEQVLHLQRTMGNRAVTRLFQSGAIQAKLKIGKPNDIYEKEADSVADRVMSMPEESVVSSHSSLGRKAEEYAQTKPLAEQIKPLIQRQADEEEEVQPKLQRQSTEEEEEPVQAKLLQRQESEEEEAQTKLQRQTEKEEEEPIQTKLIQRQGTEEEEEAVQAKLLQRQESEEEESAQTKLQRQADEEEETAQAKAAPGNTPGVTPNIESNIYSMKGGGQPLSESTRSFFELRFGTDFSRVRLHTDSKAAETARSINARAFTTGKDVVFGSGQYSPGTSGGKRLLAHELTHVVQQNNKKGSLINKKIWKATRTSRTNRISALNSRLIQRRVYVSGAVEADTNEYVNLLGTAAGYVLRRTFRNPMVRIIRARPGRVPSPSARSQLIRMVYHRRQHAEVHVGTAQPRVGIGAFPTAPSMIQLVDIDDIRNLNATTPGAGTAKAYHELVENWHHHGPGTPGFAPSHEQGVEMESTVAEELGTPGRRMLGRGQLQNIPPPAGMPAGIYLRLRQEFTTYFLEIIYRRNPGNDFQLVSSQRIPKVQVSQNVVSRFRSGSTAIPPGGNAILNRVVTDLNANADRTVAIEGFTDSRGSRTANLRNSRRRAENARAYLIRQGIAANRINIAGRGETNFVDTNRTAAGRANNRRVVLTVHRPGP